MLQSECKPVAKFVIATILYHWNTLKGYTSTRCLLAEDHPLFSSKFVSSGLLQRVLSFKNLVHTGNGMFKVCGLAASGIPPSAQALREQRNLRRKVDSVCDDVLDEKIVLLEKLKAKWSRCYQVKWQRLF